MCDNFPKCGHCNGYCKKQCDPLKDAPAIPGAGVFLCPKLNAAGTCVQAKSMIECIHK